MAKNQNHWYPRYVADYAKKTSELTMVEHGAYTLLLDHYYSTERSLPAIASVLHRVCRAFAPDEQAAVQTVLNRFFILVEDRWVHVRVEEELSKRIDLSGKRREAALKRYAAIALAKADAIADTPTPTPTLVSKEGAKAPFVRNNKIQKPKTPEPEGFGNFWKLYPKQRAGARDKAMAAYAKAIKRASVAEILAATESYALSDAVARGYAKNAAGWLNDDRWTDANVPQAPPAQQQRKRTYSDELQDAANMAISQLERQSNEIY